MTTGDWYEYQESQEDQPRSSGESNYQHHEGEIKEYDLPPPMTNGYHGDRESFDECPTPEYSEAPEPQQAYSFVARLASIPIIQEGLWGAQKVLQQNRLGRLALQGAECTLSKIQPLVEEKLNVHLERANAIGHLSLDIVEKRFPILVTTSGKQLVEAINPHTVAEEVKGRIGHAILSFCLPSEAATEDVNRRIAHVMDNVEAVLDQYFPLAPQDRQDEMKDLGAEETSPHYQLLRMCHICNSLSHRIAKRIAMQLKTSDETEGKEATEQTTRQANALRSWLSEQTWQLLNHLEQYKAQLPEPIQQHVLEPLTQIVQKEYFILRQEMERQGISSVERARNVLAASQDLVVMPLLQRSVDSMRSQVAFYRSMAQQNRAHVMTELSSRVPILAHVTKASFTGGPGEDRDSPISIHVQPSFDQGSFLDTSNLGA